MDRRVQQAILSGDEEWLRELCKDESIVWNVPDEKFGNTEITLAQHQPNKNLLKILCENPKIDVGARSSFKIWDGSIMHHSALENAFEQNDRESLEILLSAKNLASQEDILNAVDEFGNSRIMNACKAGAPFLFTALARRKEVDLCIKNKSGQTVMDLAEDELEKTCEKYDFEMTEKEKRLLGEEVLARKQILKVLKVRVREELAEMAQQRRGQQNMQNFTLDHVGLLEIPNAQGVPNAYYNHDHHAFERV